MTVKAVIDLIAELPLPSFLTMMNAFPLILTIAVAGALTCLSLSPERRKLRFVFLTLAIVGGVLSVLNPVILIPVAAVFIR
ncbi:UNVERIFIED_ORG: putative membrane channel-forming protein YqfA (hemolysin III family) [Pantoea agglomerans]